MEQILLIEVNLQIQFTLGVLDLDISFLVEKPAAITDTSSEAKGDIFIMWERSNRLSLMYLKLIVIPSIKNSLLKTKSALDFLNNVNQRFQ